MWIYYYACFGPGHQSEDYNFKYFHDHYTMEDIKDNLFNMLSDHYDICLDFWKVDAPPAGYVEKKIKSTKADIEYYKKHLKMLKGISCFVPDEKDGEDQVIQKNISGKIIHKLLYRLHKAGLMYSMKDIRDWSSGKKFPTEPNRTKILKIMRKSKSY